LGAVFLLEKVHLKRQFHFLELCTSVRRKTTAKLLFISLCSVVVDVEPYWTVIDNSVCYKCKLLKCSDKIVSHLAALRTLPHALQDAVGLG
jgi:hypothetical protein